MAYFGVRGFWIMTLAVLAAIGIGIGAEAGSVATGPKPRFRAAVQSITASPFLAIDVHVNVPLSGVAKTVVSGGVVRVELASADGHTSLSADTHESQVNGQLSLLEGGRDLADLRVVAGRNVYIRVFFDQVAALPFVPQADRSDLHAAGQLIGGEWFSVPRDLSRRLGPAPSAPQNPALRAEASAAEVRLRDDLLAAAAFSSRAVDGGTATSATVALETVVTAAERDVLPLVRDALPRGLPSLGALPPLGSLTKGAGKLRGTATLTVVTDAGGSTMQRGSLVVHTSKTRVEIDAMLRHDPLDLGAPAGARTIPRAILGQLPRIGSSSIN